MNGDRWVVRYPTGEWGVERGSRRMSHQLFTSMEDALVAARQEAASAGGGEVCVQSPDGGLSLREDVAVEQRPLPGPREPQDASRGTVAWTIVA